MGPLESPRGPEKPGPCLTGAGRSSEPYETRAAIAQVERFGGPGPQKQIRYMESSEPHGPRGNLDSAGAGQRATLFLVHPLNYVELVMAALLLLLLVLLFLLLNVIASKEILLLGPLLHDPPVLSRPQPCFHHFRAKALDKTM